MNALPLLTKTILPQFAMNIPKLHLTGILQILSLVILFGSLKTLHAQSSGTTDDGYSWEINPDGKTIKITSIPHNTIDIFIPSQINDMPVTIIGQNASYYSGASWGWDNNAHNLHIPNTVKSILKGGFFHLQNLQTLEIPDSIEVFEYYINNYGGSTYAFGNYPYLNIIGSSEIKQFLYNNRSVLFNYAGGTFIFRSANTNNPSADGIQEGLLTNIPFLQSLAASPTFLATLTYAITNQSETYGILKQGIAGANGLDGAIGPKGDTGVSGPQGLKGDKGDKGEAGATGPQGVAGSVGPQGPVGPPGLNGATGQQGPQGATGTFDPTVLTNTAFLNGLASNSTFISAISTNPAFLAAISQGLAGSTNNYGFYQKQLQTLTFPAIAPATFSYGKSVKLAVTSSAKLTPVTYSSSNDGIASVSGSALTITGAGTVTITATQVGNLTTAPATATQVFVVTPVVQTLKFGAIPAQTYAVGKSVTLAATSSAKLSPITYTSSNEGVATVSGNVLTLVGPGTSVITATQSGDGNNTSASAVQILTVK